MLLKGNFFELQNLSVYCPVAAMCRSDASNEVHQARRDRWTVANLHHGLTKSLKSCEFLPNPTVPSQVPRGTERASSGLITALWELLFIRGLALRAPSAIPLASPLKPLLLRSCAETKSLLLILGQTYVYSRRGRVFSFLFSLAPRI